MTASEYNYLLSLYELSGSMDGVRIVDLSLKTKISKASVYHALNRLINKGLASRSLEEATYNITEEGIKLITNYQGYVKKIQSWLISKLGMNIDCAYNDAIEIVCNISDEGREALLTYISN